MPYQPVTDLSPNFEGTFQAEKRIESVFAGQIEQFC